MPPRSARRCVAPLGYSSRLPESTLPRFERHPHMHPENRLFHSFPAIRWGTLLLHPPGERVQYLLLGYLQTSAHYMHTASAKSPERRRLEGYVLRLPVYGLRGPRMVLAVKIGWAGLRRPSPCSTQCARDGGQEVAGAAPAHGTPATDLLIRYVPVSNTSCLGYKLCERRHGQDALARQIRSHPSDCGPLRKDPSFW